MPNQLVRIADLDAGVFWCRARSLGISDEENDEFVAGRLPVERAVVITGIVRLAMNGLRDAPCAGVGWWMPTKRAIS